MIAFGNRGPGRSARAVRQGYAYYNRYLLAVYDFVVFRMTLPLCWRCSPVELLRLYSRNSGAHHLEMGVGTGYLLDRTGFPVSNPYITLVDINPAPLAFTARRLKRYQITRIRANVLEPLPVPHAAFDSAGVSFLLHCVPGRMPEKGVVLANAAAAVRGGGTVFGATVLSSGVPVSASARVLMWCLNMVGAFHNKTDDLAGLRTQLDRYFVNYELSVYGCVALFRARTAPRPDR
jgi:ubiquinone/menaquinone biosynthesis C-methylase UbiE